MKRLFLLFCPILFLLTACGSPRVPALPFGGACDFVAEYTSDGAVFRARFSLPAGEGAGGSVSLLSPDTAAGMTYLWQDAEAYAVYGRHTVPLASPPLPLCLLGLCRPQSAVYVSSREENGVMTLTYLASGEAILYRIRKGDTRPFEVEGMCGGSLYTLRILPEEDAAK